MSKTQKRIGDYIREVRLERGLSQEKLASMCGISNTTLSAYETGRKTPGLSTVAKLAKQMNVSIERLFYGDENSAFIIAEPDEGKKIVNSIYLLWELGVIQYSEKFGGHRGYLISEDDVPTGIYVYITSHASPIRRLLKSLEEFEMNKETYSDPEKYLELLMDSVASEINGERQAN